MTVQRARFEQKKAALSTEWGRKVAAEKFGEALLASFPTFTRGPRKGLLKGYICWLKVDVGGWCRSLPGQPGRAGVLYPGTYDWMLTMADQHADVRQHSLVARWSWDKVTRSGTVTNVQSPQEAEQLFKDYGREARCG